MYQSTLCIMLIQNEYHMWEQSVREPIFISSKQANWQTTLRTLWTMVMLSQALSLSDIQYVHLNACRISHTAAESAGLVSSFKS